MSRLPQTMELDRLGIERLPVKEEVKVWLRRLVDACEEKYLLIREFAEAGGFQTKIWRGKEDGDGHLIIQERINGVWTNSGWRLKKA